MVRIAALVGVMMVLAGCSNGEFLTGDGPAAAWVEEASAPSRPPTTTSTTTIPPPPLRPTVGVSWWNDPLALPAGVDPAGATPDEVIAAVWSAASGTDRYVQVARADIAHALPGAAFPSMLPEEARYISSQLVFSLGDGRLAQDVAAAFGVWTVEPYTQPRDQSQVAVFVVGWDDVDRAALAVDPSGGCAWFRDRDFRSCDTGPDDLGPSWWVETFEGRTLIWLDGVYRYELRGRGVASSVVEAMARSMVPLSEFGPPGEAGVEG